MNDTNESKEKGNPKYKEAREHMRAAHRAWHESVRMMMPEGFYEQRKTARKEFLMGIRSMVDAALERMEQK